MNFSSLVLMERDKDTNFLVREIGSYEVGDGATCITKMYYDGESVHVYFDTNRDVEEWEFSAIYDLFNEEAFNTMGYNIEVVDDEYNPTWLVKFNLEEEHSEMTEKLRELCSLIEEELENVFENIKDKEQDYI